MAVTNVIKSLYVPGGRYGIISSIMAARYLLQVAMKARGGTF